MADTKAFITPWRQLQSVNKPAALRGTMQLPAAGLSTEATQNFALGSAVLATVAVSGMAVVRRTATSKRGPVKSRVIACASATGKHCAEYTTELLETVKALTTPGKG